MNTRAGRITLRDATLREGLDTPKVEFSAEQRLRIARMLSEAGVVEAEVMAPSSVSHDLEWVRRLRAEGIALRTSGLVYAHRPDGRREVAEAAPLLDHIDLLMPVSPERPPHERKTKFRLLEEALELACGAHAEIGAGFPHATQCDLQLLVEISAAAVARGARRIIVYDTNGSADPFSVRERIEALRERLPETAVFFHGHNDLGMATANALSAVTAGAAGLDVTVNGIGDRAGNAALEQVALALHLRGFSTGIRLDRLRTLSRVVEEESGVAVSKLAPVVGEYVLWHRSPSHLREPGLFEAFDPRLILSERKIDDA